MGSINILEKINLELQREVRLLKSTSKKADPVALLGPHQTALNRIIREVKAIKPALASIKNAYDNVFHSLLEQAEEIPMLKSTLARLADEKDQAMIEYFEELKSVKKENEREKKEIQADLKKSELSRLDQEEIIRKLKEDMGTLYEQFLEEKASRRLLITDLNSRTQEEQRKEDKIETKDPVHLEIARDQARKDLALAREELATIKAEYNDVVPRKLWETAENNLKDANQELEALKKDLSELSGNFSVLKSTYDSVEKERNEVVIERNELKRTGTPRPDWEAIYEKTFDEKFGDPELSSDARTKHLLDELTKSRDNTEKDYFTLPEDQSDLPAFLASEERKEVKNLKLTIEDCNEIKEEIWKERLAENDDEVDKIDIFVKNFLSKKFNFYALDFGHSLRAAAEKYADLPHITDFYEILAGLKPEQGFKRIVEQSSNLLSALQNVDKHKKGYVLVFDLKVELRKLFKLKPDEHMEIIAQFAEEDKFYYGELFENGPNGEPSKMMSLLAEQDEKEKDIYVEQLSVQLEGIDSVGPAEAKIAFMSVDPGINAELINKYIKIGLKDAKNLPAEEFLTNLKNGPVYRISPAVELF